MTHHEVHDSDVPIKTTFIRCHKCLKTATAWWPVVPGSKPDPYCTTCLDNAKTRMLIAVGVRTHS